MKNKDENFDEWQRWWDARVAAMETLFGKTENMVLHALIPLGLGAEVGGAADLVYFKNHIPGIVAVTCELIGRDDQKKNTLGNYELAICHRTEEKWGPNLIARLANYTLEATLKPGDTMSIDSIVPKGSDISALLFIEFGRFEVRNRKAGILLCIGITEGELAACRAGECQDVENALHRRGVYPYTDLNRESVV